MHGTKAPITPSRLEPILRPMNAFLSAEYAGGIVLLVSAVVAVVWANSPWRDGYHHFWHTPLGFSSGGFSFSLSLEEWVNDGLMVIFFLLVGLEIKRELLIGELASVRRAALPIAAAIGGMVVPAGIYLLFNARGEGSHGWGVPMATDIAFAVGVLALVGRWIPTPVKVFLLAVAIVDDLGAVVVIALFYTGHIMIAGVIAALVFLVALVTLNLLRVHSPLPYVLLGIGLWATTLYSGIHATVAGVLLAFTIPATRQIEEQSYLDFVRKMLLGFEKEMQIDPGKITDEQSHALKAMEEASQAVQTPLARVEHALLVPVNRIIVPLFALANAGVDLRSGGGPSMGNPILWGILLGLFVGKPVGVLLASWAAVKSGVASLPKGATVQQMVGVAVLCGIGFTMSLFVTGLAFPGDEAHLMASKFGILAGSLLAGVLGGAIIALAKKPQKPAEGVVLTAH